MPNNQDYIVKKLGEDSTNPEDPYNTPFHQANLVKQKKQTFLKTQSSSEKEAINTRIHINISLVPGGVEVAYNDEAISFPNKDDEILFRREINSFFINNNFRLNSIFFPVSVYKCGTRENGDIAEFIFAPNDMMISREEAHGLNLIVSKVLQKTMF